ncbi:helix-turn-helix domain-containing protein [Sulfurovum sp.]|uniref:helix-turn-helix domain-containing protein n=1 Tax=Sulfurovum sp. TaxID=1969726 RepID=UPI002867DF52|nr:helix-turn-helix domain-containing protein [Sulfurovum sp.]
METFFTTSDKIQHIIKSFNLTKTLFVSSIIVGEPHTGKKTLARYLFPDALLVSGKNQEAVKEGLENYDELIITDFEQLSNPSSLNFDNKRIIATANYLGNATLVDDLFAFIYTMPSLKERPEDIEYLKSLFVKEACETLMIEEDQVVIDALPLNLSLNSKSLKRSIYLDIVKLSMGASEIQEIIYQYTLKHLDGNDGYREYLELYEKPLIQAGLKKYGSQLQLSQVLGINRNTLRKKIHEHHID